MSADERLEEVCETLEDPDVELRRKISTILTIPRIFTVQELTTERCEKLFTSAPVEVFDCVLNSEDRQFQDGKPLIAHILSFCCQMTSPTTHMKFKPVIANIVKLSTPKNGPLTTSTLNDITIIVTYMSDDRKCIYDFLRNTTSYFINQGEKLEVEVFLSISKLLLSKIFSLINVGDDASTIDTRVWPVGILSIIRNLIKEKTEKMSETIIIGIWDIIGSVSRLMGPDWFSLDENFAKIVAQMNTVEINMALHTADSIDVVKFARHLRILEVFVSAINDEEIFTEGGTLNDVCLAVGSGVRYILLFWIEVTNTSIKLADEVLLNLFTFTIFLLSRGELEIADEKQREQIDKLILTEALRIVDDYENIQDVSRLYEELFEKMDDLKVLDERVPLIAVKFLARMREVQRRDAWKIVCIETTVALMELRGRKDWYNKTSIKESLKLLENFNEDDQHDISSLRKLFEKLS